MFRKKLQIFEKENFRVRELSNIIGRGGQGGYAYIAYVVRSVDDGGSRGKIFMLKI